jgi:hypothetical protein
MPLNELELRLEDGALVLHARGQFLRDEDGRLEWLRFGLRIHAPVS